MSVRDIATIVIVALAIPALLLVRLVPVVKVDPTEGVEVSRAAARGQAWFYGGAISVALILLLLRVC
jgi:hypothetical protein